MKTSAAPIALAALALVTGCAATQLDPTVVVPVCTSDLDCGAGQVCFQDGCGDPERGLAVEVVPDTRAGLNAQDFQVDAFRGVQDLQLFPPSSASGQITLGDQPYSGRVSVRLVGESELIPGRERVYGGPLTPDAEGYYSVPAGTGVYSMQFQAVDPSIPPVTAPEVHIGPGQTVAVKAQLASDGQVLKLAGVLVRSLKDPSPLGAVVDVQAVDAETGQALSQRVPIASDTGAFVLSVAPEAAQKDVIGIKAQPRATSSGPALVPTRLFTVPTRGALPTLELGDYGVPVTVSGRVVGSDGNPIEGATVYLDGKVQGGGTFTSASVKTDATGAFSGLQTLASDPTGELALWAVPPAKSVSGQLRMAVTVTPSGGSLGDLRCPDRVPVQGQVHRPDGRDFPGVKVVAHAVGTADGALPPPSLKVETTTDDNATFTLRLDPGVWKLDFIPPPLEGLPLASRQVTVKAELLATGGNKTISMPPLTISKGRTVTGTVTLYPSAGAAPVPVPYASVHYFRVTTIEGKRVAEMLAEGVSDDHASYSVVLPTR